MRKVSRLKPRGSVRGTRRRSERYVAKWEIPIELCKRERALRPQDVSTQTFQSNLIDSVL